VVDAVFRKPLDLDSILRFLDGSPPPPVLDEARPAE